MGVVEGFGLGSALLGFSSWTSTTHVFRGFRLLSGHRQDFAVEIVTERDIVRRLLCRKLGLGDKFNAV